MHSGILRVFSSFLFILFLVSQAVGNPTYSHIQLGHIQYGTADIPDMAYFGARHDFLLSTQTSKNHSAARTANSGLIIVNYLKGSGFYKEYPNLNEYVNFATWCAANPPCDAENAFYHYRTDKTRTDQTTCEFVGGYTLSMIPGYGAGQSAAGNESHSRVPTYPWGACTTRTYTISTISGDGATVTVDTSTSHLRSVGDRIEISGTVNHNGYWTIAGITDSNTFTYASTTSNAEAAGTVTLHGYTHMLINYKDSQMAEYQGTLSETGLKDAGNNKFNGWYWDSTTTQLDYRSTIEFSTKVEECLAAGATCTADVSGWLLGYMKTYFAETKTGVTTWLAGERTAYTAGNTTFRRIKTDANHYALITAADGLDIILIEYYAYPGASYYDSNLQDILTRWYDAMAVSGKKVVLEYQGRQDFGAGQITWTLDSGAIWYTDYFAGGVASPNTIGFTVGGTVRYANTVATSKASMVAGSNYVDTSTGRLYVWLNNGGDPNALTAGYIYGLDRGRMYGLALYYTAFGHANGIFMYGDQYAIYGILPFTNKSWLGEAIAYNVGTPATGGYNWDNATDTWVQTGNDLWGTATKTSSLMYEMWNGTGELDDASTALTSSHKLYARKYTNAYAIFRPLNASTSKSGTNKKTFTMPFNFRELKTDNTLGALTDQVTIGQGEGVILVLDYVEPPPTVVPVVATIEPTSITTTTATSGGNVTSAGGGTVTARGVCWNTTGSPTVTDSCTSDGTGTGVFSSSITGLTPSTAYHVRAFATNSAGTAYGGDVQFNSAGQASITGIGSGTGPHTITIQGTGTLTITITTP